MNWFWLSSLAGIASNGFNITNRTVLKDRGDHNAYAWWFELVRTSFFLILVLRQPLNVINLSNLLPLILVGLTELFSVYVFMKMHAYTELSISSIISRLRVVWSPLLAWFLVNERLTLSGYLGIITIFTGIALVSSPKKLRTDKGIRVAIVFSFSSALLSTVLKGVSGIATPELIIVSQGIIPLFVLPVFMKNSTARIIQIGLRKLPQILLAGAFNIVSSYLLVKALVLTDASKVVGLYQAMTVLSVIYGILVLKEKERLIQKIVGTLIVIIGIFIIVN